MLGLFFRSKKEQERTADKQIPEPAQDPKQRPASSGQKQKQPPKPHEQAGPDSPMKKQRVAAAAGAASASHPHHRDHRQPPPAAPAAAAPRGHHPHQGTDEEAALLAELADAEWTLSAGGEAGIAAGAATIKAAVQAIAELRGRWRAYSRANDALAAGGGGGSGGVGAGGGAGAGKAAKAGGAGKGGKQSGGSNACPGPLTAKEKLELSEMGLRAQLTLDGAETGGRADVRALRKRATVAAEALLDAVAAAPEAAARPTPPPSPRVGRV